jgi:hypothetical protein
MLDKIKNGQVSIFIVIGVVFLLVASFFIFSNDYEIFVSKEDKLKTQVLDVVEKCIYDNSRTGIFLLGFQGGQLEMDEASRFDFTRYTDFGFKIQNWDSERDEVPTIGTMEVELENYVEENAMSCIDGNLNSLSEFMEIEYDGILDVITTINDENIIVEGNLPITFNERNTEEVYEVDDYYVKFDSLRLGDIYDLATQIYNLEQNTNFVEDLVLDQIYSSSDYSDPNSMPSEGLFFSCSPRVWTIPQLKRNLANLNNNNFKYLQFDGTYPIDSVFDANLNEELGTEDLRDYFYNFYTFGLENPKSSFRNYRVEVIMPSTEVTGETGILQRYPYREFEVTPSNGDLVKAQNFKVDVGAKIPIPCVQIFHHLYTLDYDLIVKITDYSADSNFYTFQFPLRVEINNNNPKELAASPIIDSEPLTATNEAFCSDDARQFPLRIFAQDNSENFLNDVNVSYKCISLSCDLGQTSKPTFNGVTRIYSQPYLETDFPFCVGGQVIVEKEGYHKGEIRVDTTQELLESDLVEFVDVSMIPLKTFEIDYTTFLIVDKDTRKGSRVRNSSDGSIFITVENKGLDFESSVIWPAEVEGFYDKLSLLDSDEVVYNLTMYYSDEDFALRGLVQRENIVINPNTGNRLDVIIPAISDVIDEDNYFDYIEFSNLAIESGEFGLFIR